MIAKTWRAHDAWTGWSGESSRLNERRSFVRDANAKAVGTPASRIKPQRDRTRCGLDNIPVRQQSIVDAGFQEPRQAVEVRILLDEANFGDQGLRVDQFFKRHKVQIKLPRY